MGLPEVDMGCTIDRPDAVALIVTDEEGRFLIFWHTKYNFWTLPLGKVEPDEEGLFAAGREAYEELGIVPSEIDVVATVYKPRNIDDYADINIALCHVVSYSGEISNREPEKHEMLQFVCARDAAMLQPTSFPTQALLERFSADEIVGSRSEDFIARPSDRPGLSTVY